MTDDHHSGLTQDDVRKALEHAMDVYKRAGCDCCSPNPLEDLWEDMTTEDAEKLRAWGIDLAFTGQSIVDYYAR